MAVGQILRDFSGWTSAHGVPHIGSAQNLCLRIFWTCVFLFSTAILVYQQMNLIKTYLAYDVTVSTELKFEERNFPVVTLCNLNPYKKSSVVPGSDLEEMLQNFIYASTNPALVDNATWGFAGLEPVIYRSRALHALVLIGGEYTTEKLNETTYTKEEFILSCAYNTKACGEQDFKLTYDPYYGACYQFNTEATYKSTRAGPLYGLRVLMKVNQSEYLDTARAAGVRVSVHGQNEEPFPDAFGLTAAPGFTTSFGTKFTITERKSQPYGNCTTSIPEDTSYYYSATYSTEGCFRSCIQDAIVARCRCADPRFPTPSGEQPCSYLNLECVSDFYANSGSGRRFNTVRDCLCPQPCTEPSYGVTVSTASWPSEVYSPPECEASGTSWSCHEWYAENTLFVEVFYERMNFQVLKENEAYGIVNLISDMGGQLGLWMGVSVISVVEFFSLLILLCVYCIARKRSDQREFDDSDDENFDDDDDHEDEDAKTPAPPSDDLYDKTNQIDNPPPVHG